MLVKSKLEMAKFNFVGLLLISFWSLCLTYGAADAYQIGVGRADCTGPPNQIIFVSIITTKYRILVAPQVGV